MNPKLALALLATGITLLSCKKEADLPKMDTSSITDAQAQRIKQGRSSATSTLLPSTITFNAPNLYPEGLTFDPFRNSFIVSSAYSGNVGTVTYDGTYQPLTTDPNLMSTTGLKVDKARKRIWVINLPVGIGAYDLSTGNPLFFTDLTSLLPDQPLFLNDEAITPTGDVYVTNSAAPVIYKVDVNGHASVFFQHDEFATGPADFGFNGLQYDERGFLLVTHTALNQIIKIPVRDPEHFSIVQLNEALFMPDGLLLSKDGNQVVVVSFDRVLSFTSKDQWSSGSLSTSYLTGTEFPTSLTSDGHRVYVLYSPLDKLLNGEDNDSYTIQQVPLNKPDPF